jgi:hypothetical protein
MSGLAVKPDHEYPTGHNDAVSVLVVSKGII